MSMRPCREPVLISEAKITKMQAVSLFWTRRGPRISGFQTAPNVLGSTGPTRVADRRILEPGSAKDGRGFLGTEGYPKNSLSYPKKTRAFGSWGSVGVLCFVFVAATKCDIGMIA